MKHIGKTITLPAVAAILLLAGCSREFKVDNGANFKKICLILLFSSCAMMTARLSALKSHSCG